MPVTVQTLLEVSSLQIESQTVMSIDRKIIILSSENFEKSQFIIQMRQCNSTRQSPFDGYLQTYAHIFRSKYQISKVMLNNCSIEHIGHFTSMNSNDFGAQHCPNACSIYEKNVCCLFFSVIFDWKLNHELSYYWHCRLLINHHHKYLWHFSKCCAQCLLNSFLCYFSLFLSLTMLWLFYFDFYLCQSFVFDVVDTYFTIKIKNWMDRIYVQLKWNARKKKERIKIWHKQCYHIRLWCEKSQIFDWLVALFRWISVIERKTNLFDMHHSVHNK